MTFKFSFLSLFTQKKILLLTGLTEKMRNDFNMMKDLACHTRLPPEQRQREIGRLVEYIRKYATLMSFVLFYRTDFSWQTTFL